MPAAVPPISLLITPVLDWVKLPAMVIVPAEAPGAKVPSFLTLAVMVPLPVTVPPSMLTVSGEENVPPMSCVEPAVCV